MKTLSETVERCARGAYNTYMSGSMGSEWQYVNTESYAWVFDIPHKVFMDMCKKEYAKLFNTKGK
jgi:hypothetical protein